MTPESGEITISCTSCNATYRIPDQIVGKVVTCKKCRQKFKAEPVSPVTKYPLIGRIALENRLVKEDDLVKALSIQKAIQQKTGKDFPLEDILCKKGMISESQKSILLTTVMRQLDKEFCRIAVRQNKITQEKADQAFAEQAGRFKANRESISVGDILVLSGELTRQECDTILLMQNRIKKEPESTSKGISQVMPDGPPEPEEKVEVQASAETDAPAGEPPAPGPDMSEKIEVLKDKKFFHIRNLDKEFGTIIIEDNLVTRSEVDRVLEKQLEGFQATGIRMLIGNLLVDEGVLTPEQRDTVLAKQKRVISNEDKLGENVVHKDDPAKEGDEPDMTVIETRFRDIDFQISVSQDRMRAFLCRKTVVPESLDVSDIKDFLMDHKIAYGLMDDKMLETFLRYDGYLGKKFQVAQGKPAKSGRSGKIKYYFDTEYLKAGAVHEDGQIDYKDRGEIPHVPKGMLLAEKIPMIEGEKGIDVYGLPVNHEVIRDINLKAGLGVELIEDGQKAFSKVDGQPEASFGGKISVLSELKIQGDVGYETGHIDFDGNVNVGGIVQSGFRVKAASLSANEVMNAEIELTGDLKVAGGIIDAKLNLQGGMKAKYLNNATISSYGDIEIQKEIIDSKIETSGMCIVKSGKILSSDISAKKGIIAGQIGTDLSSPCSLWVGVDSHLNNEIEKIQTRISAFLQQKDELLATEQELSEEDIQLQVDIANYAQVQDRSMIEKRDLEKKMAEESGTMDKESRIKAEEQIHTLIQKGREADETINQLFIRQDNLEERKNKMKNSLKEIEESINDLQNEKQEKLEWSRSQKLSPNVTVTGLICEGTIISGQNSSITLDRSYKRAQIQEVRIDSSRGKDIWAMKVNV
ncbi:MAG: DUF342 domain-containing protein [Deltaproteobacteria bacterium]|nr:MAG: DUF342 domain-containing protein [Deltaproteobacteria bacterium]